MEKLKLCYIVDTYIKLMRYDINNFTIPFIDVHDDNKPYLLYNQKSYTGDVLGISKDGKEFCWFDNENYNLPY